MTDNRETIEMLKMLKDQALKSHNDTAVLEVKIDSFNFVLDEAIKALEQEPCEDAISREAVLEKAVYTETEEGWSGRTVDVKDIEALPPVTPKEKTGHWIYTGDYITDGMLKCSSCGYEHDVADRFLYCPNCGAKMVKPQESEVNNG